MILKLFPLLTLILATLCLYRFPFYSDTRYGVELDQAIGKNDGTVGGEFYFPAKPNHGVLVVPDKCSLTGMMRALQQPLSPPPMSPPEPPMSPKPEEV